MKEISSGLCGLNKRQRQRRLRYRFRPAASEDVILGTRSLEPNEITMFTPTTYHSNRSSNSTVSSGDMNLTFVIEDPQNDLAPISIANFVICYLAIVLNLTEMVMIARKKRKNAFEWILLSLSIADTLAPISYTSQGLYEHFQRKALYTGRLRYMLEFPLEIFSVTSSISNIIILGVDRIIAVKYPLKHAVWITKRTTNLMILGAWIASIVLSILPNMKHFIQPSGVALETTQETSIYVFSGILFASGVAISATYAEIVRVVIVYGNRRRKSMGTNSKSIRTRSDELAVTVTCVLVVFAFLLCSYPYAIDMLINLQPTWPFATIFLNAVLDPLIYFFKGYIQKRLQKQSKSCEKQAMENRNIPTYLKHGIGQRDFDPNRDNSNTNLVIKSMDDLTQIKETSFTQNQEVGATNSVLNSPGKL